MAALEDGLGVKLLTRNNRRILLTEVGTHFYEHCVSVLDELEEAEAQAKEYTLNPKGSIKVNVPVTFGRLYVVPHLPAFLNMYPEINLDLSLLDRQVDLLGEGIDTVIRIGRLEDSSLVAKKIGSSPKVMVASPQYLKTNGTPRTLEALKQHNCIIYTHLSSFDRWHFDYQGMEVSVHVSGTIRSNSSDVIRQCVLSDLGIAVSPRWLVQADLESGEMVTLLEDYIPTEFPINALYPQNRYIPCRVKCFINYFNDVFAQYSVLATTGSAE